MQGSGLNHTVMRLLALSLLAGCARIDQMRESGGTQLRDEPASGAARTPVTIQQAVSPVPRSEFDCFPPQHPPPADAPPLELIWARSLWSSPQWEGRTVLVTCHGLDSLEYLFRFHEKREGRFIPLHQFCFGEGYLIEAEEFTLERNRFMFFRLVSGGSASYFDHRVVWLGPASWSSSETPEIREVEIEPPVTSLSHLLRDGQHSESGRTFIERDQGTGLRFWFSIWNRGEHNNFPTGGHVEGRLRLVVDDRGIPRRFTVDRFELYEP